VNDLAIVLVHYRTPVLLVDAVEALLRDLASSCLSAEIVVVDNGSEPADRAAWNELPLRRIDPGANLGYAGGVRCGVEATSAASIVAMNPDVLVVEGCPSRLHAGSNAAAAGPQFFWDDACFFLPSSSRERPAPRSPGAFRT
jgi:GT2 family glycosyltransferase